MQIVANAMFTSPRLIIKFSLEFWLFSVTIPKIRLGRYNAVELGRGDTEIKISFHFWNDWRSGIRNEAPFLVYRSHRAKLNLVNFCWLIRLGE